MGGKSNNRRKSTQSDTSKSTKSTGSASTGSAAEFTEFDEKPILESIKNEIQQSMAHPTNELHEHVEGRDDSWETESLLQDMLEGATEEEHMDSKYFCQSTSRLQFRQRGIIASATTTSNLVSKSTC